jgi:tetratricopeptide (TPR) repeat protein
MHIMTRKEQKTLTAIALAIYFVAGMLAFFCEDAEAQRRGRKQSVVSLITQTLQFSSVETTDFKYNEALTTMKAFYYFDEAEFTQAQTELNKAGNCEHALAFAGWATQAFPKSPAAWEELAKRQTLAGDGENAVLNFMKVLELDPNHGDAQRQLNEIELALTDANGETEVTVGFSPGSQTNYFGDYLGEEPPGTTPVVFAPGLISTSCSFEYSLTFAPTGDHLLFSRDNTLYRMTRTDAGWSAPFATPFQGFEPAISPDGQSLYICQGPEIHRLERSAAGWRAPEKVADGMRGMADEVGNLYLTQLNGVNSEIAFSRFIDGAYGEATALPAPVNSPHGDAHPCIAPDGSFLIFDSNRPGALGGEYDYDFYICFRNSDGAWGAPRHLGEIINTPGKNICASLSPDGKYLFYTAYSDIYWVSTEIFDSFRDQ